MTAKVSWYSTTVTIEQPQRIVSVSSFIIQPSSFGFRHFNHAQ